MPTSGYAHTNIIISIRTPYFLSRAMIQSSTAAFVHRKEMSVPLCFLSAAWQQPVLPACSGKPSSSYRYTTERATWLQKTHTSGFLLVGSKGFSLPSVLRKKVNSALKVFTYWTSVLASSRFISKSHPKPIVLLPVLHKMQLLCKYLLRCLLRRGPHSMSSSRASGEAASHIKLSSTLGHTAQAA